MPSNLDDPGGSGHWTWSEQGCKPNPMLYFGYIYLVTHLPTGRMYCGRKQYFRSKRIAGCSNRVTDRQSEKFKLKCWTDSGWRIYTGSSSSLNKLIEEEGKDNFKFEILKQCRSKSHLHYEECKELWKRDVLQAKFEDGTFVYFNNSIPAQKFKIQEKLD